MTRIVLRRLLLMVPAFVGITLATFFVANAMPGDPTAAVEGETASPHTAGATAELRRLQGLEGPLLVRYGRWAAHVARLDFGASTYDHRAVSDKLAEALPNSALLAAGALLLTYAGALLVGLACALKPGGAVDRALSAGAFVAYSVPGALAAILLLLLLAGGRYLQIFPLQGLQSAGDLGPLARAGDLLWHLALPVFCLSYAGIAAVSRYVRGGVIEALGQEYIRAVRAKGVGPFGVVFRHALRNAALPLLTLVGMSIPHLLGGSVVIEQIFAIPGLGRLALQAVATRDYPTLMGVTTVAALATMVAMLFADLAYELADPRVRLRGGGR